MSRTKAAKRRELSGLSSVALLRKPSAYEKQFYLSVRFKVFHTYPRWANAPDRYLNVRCTQDTLEIKHTEVLLLYHYSN